MSGPPADLSQLKDFDTPDVVAPAFRRFRWWLIAMLILVAAASAFAGYSVDQTRTKDLRGLLRKADMLQTQPVRADPLPYFSLHNDLAAAAGVEPCSAFAVRMTQRFLPEGWAFNAEDVAALRGGGEVESIRVDMGRSMPNTWHC